MWLQFVAKQENNAIQRLKLAADDEDTNASSEAAASGSVFIPE
jgi:hypothetical protein